MIKLQLCINDFSQVKASITTPKCIEEFLSEASQAHDFCILHDGAVFRLREMELRTALQKMNIDSIRRKLLAEGIVGITIESRLELFPSVRTDTIEQIMNAYYKKHPASAQAMELLNSPLDGIIRRLLERLVVTTQIATVGAQKKVADEQGPTSMLYGIDTWIDTIGQEERLQSDLMTNETRLLCQLIQNKLFAEDRHFLQTYFSDPAPAPNVSIHIDKTKAKPKIDLCMNFGKKRSEELAELPFWGRVTHVVNTKVNVLPLLPKDTTKVPQLYIDYGQYVSEAYIWFIDTSASKTILLS